MLNFEFCRKTNYVFGRDVENQVGKLIKSLGYKKVMLVYGKGSIVRSGLLDKVLVILNKEGIEVVSLGGVRPNPHADLVYTGIELGKAQKVEFMLAIGGGSVIDTAKAIALGIPDNGDFFDFYLKKRKPQKALQTGVILTIPAAGSEGSTSSVIEKEIDGKVVKTGVNTDLNVPAFALLNPEFTYSLPAYQTACGISDMMAHIMERYFTNTCNVLVTDRLCEGLLLAIIENASIVIHDPDNYDARANLMWAGSLAHNNICGVDREQDWASHHLGHQLSALYDTAHGASLSVMFPAWMEFTYKHNVMRFAQFANRVFGCAMNFEEPEITARAGIAALRDFFQSIGLPLSFEDIGAKESDIPTLLNMLGVDDSNSTEGHFMILHRRECEQIYKNAARYKG